jgi:hypothetical protein
LTVSSLSQDWALAVFSLRHKNTYEWYKTRTNTLKICIRSKLTFSSRNQCLYLWLYQKSKSSKKDQKSSFIQVILSLAIYSSSGNSSSLTQAWYQIAVIVHFYPSLKSSSGNLGLNVSISSQAQATCWCLTAWLTQNEIHTFNCWHRESWTVPNIRIISLGFRPNWKMMAIQPHFIVQGAVKAWIIANFNEFNK